MSPMSMAHGADVAEAMLALGQKAVAYMRAEVEARQAARAALVELSTQVDEFGEEAGFSTPIAFEGLVRSFEIYAKELAEPCCSSTGRSTSVLADDLEETLEVMKLGVTRLRRAAS